MPAVFTYAEFQQMCPWKHDTVIAHLAERHFGAGSAKRQIRHKENLHAIIDATFALADDMGFARMSMRDLHKRSGISLGGLYNYVESKEALALMITNALHLIAFDWLPTLSADALPAQQRLERLIRGHIYLSEDLRPWFYFVFMESKNLPSANKHSATEVELSFQALLQAHMGGDLLPAAHIMALMQDWHVKHWKYRHTDIDTFADSVVKLSLSCLGDPTRATE